MAIRNRKFLILTRTAFVAVLVISPLSAQSAGPLYRAETKTQSEKHARRATLPRLGAVVTAPMEYRLAPLSAGELRPKVQKMAGFAGVHRQVKAEVLQIGSWTTLDDGRRIWRLALQSPDGGSNAFEIEVPQGATRLEVKLATAPADVDVDLFIRFGSAPAVVNGSVTSDVHTEGPAGNESVVITPSGTPALRGGTYYIALGIFSTGREAQATVTATITGGSNPDAGSGSATRLQPGSPQRIQIPAVSSPTLFSGARSFAVVVPQGASRLNIRLNTTPAEADLDLFVRFGASPEVNGGRVQADYQSTGPAGNETISITSASGPPLRAGTYYVALGAFTAGVPVEAVITAELDGGSSPDAGGSTGPSVLTSGSPGSFNLAAVSSPTLFNGARSFVIDVPQGAQRL